MNTHVLANNVGEMVPESCYEPYQSSKDMNQAAQVSDLPEPKDCDKCQCTSAFVGSKKLLTGHTRAECQRECDSLDWCQLVMHKKVGGVVTQSDCWLMENDSCDIVHIDYLPDTDTSINMFAGNFYTVDQKSTSCNDCADISGCYTVSWNAAAFAYLEPIDQSMCVYRIKHALNTEGTSGLTPSNPTHLRYFVDSNGDNQLEMGFLDESTLTWGADSISRVTTNNGGIQLKTTLNWSNGGLYIDSGYENIEGCGVSSSPTLMPTMEPTSPASHICEKQGQCVNSNNGAVFATMTARHLMTKADCITAFESCNDAAGASFRQSTNTCQIFGDGGLPKCAAVTGWQPGNVFDRSAGPITSTTGTAAPWIDVTCFSLDLCAPPVCEMQGQCQNSNHNAIFATMPRHSMPKEQCIQSYQDCGDAAGASWRSSSSTCQIFGDGGIPKCAAVAGWQPGNVGDRSTGPVTSTTGTAAPWIDVTCFSPDLCDAVVKMEMEVFGWTRSQFTANKDAFTATLATILGLSPSQVQASLRTLGWLRRNLDGGLSIYVRIKAQD